MPEPHPLADITDVVITPLEDSIYIKPLSMHFKHNGINRTWDLLEVHDSVAIVIFNTTRQTLVFVKQFRPAVYVSGIPKEDRVGKIDIEKYPPEKGITLELCAGIVDKDIPLEEIAKEEVLEECGYSVEKLERVVSHKSGVGFSGSTQTIYYCEVTDEMKVSAGGGIHDENIEVVEMTIPEVVNYIEGKEKNSPAGFLLSIYWFLNNKVTKDKL